MRCCKASKIVYLHVCVFLSGAQPMLYSSVVVFFQGQVLAYVHPHNGTIKEIQLSSTHSDVFDYPLECLSQVYSILCPRLILILRLWQRDKTRRLIRPSLIPLPSCLTEKHNTTLCRCDPRISDYTHARSARCQQAQLAAPDGIQLVRGYNGRVPPARFKGTYLHLGYQTFGSGPGAGNPMSKREKLTPQITKSLIPKKEVVILNFFTV